MRLIDADKIDFNEVFVGASKFAEDTRQAGKMLIDAQPTAYDVDKVIEAINNRINKLDTSQEVFYECGLFGAADAKARQIAIYAECREIVESGGCGEIDNNGWIPCSERLPENFEPEAKAYLTTNEEGMIGVSYYHHMCGWSNGYESVFDVIAWQPLPEPYREEQE